MYDLILKGGRVIDPAAGIDRVADVAFSGGTVAKVGAGITDGAKTVRDVAGSIVCPGLIDLHVHVYHLGTSIGVDPDALSRVGGTTTLVDAGTAGAGIFAGFRAHIIEPAKTRILAYLNVSYPGIYGFGPPINVGECQDMRLIHWGECVRVARQHKDIIVGVKVRIGEGISDGERLLEVALAAAEELGLPVMTHLGRPPPAIEKVVDLMRPGDVLTHCSRPKPNAPVRPDGGVRDCFLAARERGVLFDVGHGGGSFGFQTARALLAEGFMPDTISSDVHSHSIDGPAFNLLVTMSKFLNLGVDVPDIVRMTTSAPAAAVHRPDLGHLGEGAVGEATVLDIEEGAFELTDAAGETVTGDRRFRVVARVVDGVLCDDSQQAEAAD